VCITVAHTNAHSKAIVELIKLPLALPFCIYATLDDMFELLPVWQSVNFTVESFVRLFADIAMVSQNVQQRLPGIALKLQLFSIGKGLATASPLSNMILVIV
jgi:hypothetical protein